MSSESPNRSVEHTRKAILSRTLETLESLRHEQWPEIEDELNEIQVIDVSRAPEIVITFTPGNAGLSESALNNMPGLELQLLMLHDRRVKDPTALTIVLRDSYRAEARFHNPVSGELEPFQLTQEEQKRLDEYAAITGRRNVRTFEVLRTMTDSIGNPKSLDTMTLELILLGNIQEATEIAAELREREGHIQTLQKDALRRCLDTAWELFLQSMEQTPPPNA